MRKQRNGKWISPLAAALYVLTVCLAGSPQGFAGEQKPVQNHRAETSSQQGKKTSARSSTKKSAGKKDETAALKQQLARQQAQINQLLQVVGQLQQRLDEVSHNSNVSSAHFPSVGKEASLTPVIPQEASAAKKDQELPLVPGNQPRVLNAEDGAPAGQQEEKSKLSDLAYGKIKIGGTFYGDYAFYANTGFGPQFLTQTNQPGPGNDGFNSFDVSRTYINIFYTPNDAVTLRFTPNIYRQVGGASAQSFGKGAAIGSSVNGNLSFRLKYAYVDFNKLFANSEAFGKDKLTIGQTTNPLVDWEEGLYGYRYVNLTPWNYLSLSSTYTGATLHGPVMFNGKEYLDYHLGVFNTASFHAIEQNDKKQVMGRLTWYPVGTTKDRTGMGFTVFEDYGYSTQTPDTRSIPLYRFAALAHYQTHSGNYGIAGEFDLGRNAFGTGNLFSGSGPADEFGLGPTPYANFDALAKALLGGDRTKQRGFDVFGHARIAQSPFTVFGMYQYFQPNTNVSKNPLDFQRLVAGISYKYNKHLEFALNSQNLLYTKGQFTFPASELAKFNPGLAASNPNGIANAVPKNTQAIFVNVLFNY